MFRSTHSTIFRGRAYLLCAVTRLDSADVRLLIVFVVCGCMSLPSVCMCVLSSCSGAVWSCRNLSGHDSMTRQSTA